MGKVTEKIPIDYYDREKKAFYGSGIGGFMGNLYICKNIYL